MLSEFSDLCALKDVPHEARARARKTVGHTLALAPHLLKVPRPSPAALLRIFISFREHETARESAR